MSIVDFKAQMKKVKDQDQEVNVQINGQTLQVVQFGEKDGGLCLTCGTSDDGARVEDIIICIEDEFGYEYSLEERKQMFVFIEKEGQKYPVTRVDGSTIYID